ncbi:hypothetical protein PF005_g20112 [Phytophthora fragariae]|uniref:Uncharacterized protein n=1 Tax=Phytophthora fragariae TaxID=53985 RepID=A0A6A3WNE0_9STRA|nr:hypothetical protein PF009_g21048 [Phytophthora fragariae]KAE9087655.1 hypothetical protein PF007_g20290 [Phytophthora fragariae]KAE9188309.1 hypothetical protein PF005_g20112 [Phytophthora fragariae]KAE9201939.1 hypothetical protein PF002_g21390 [Phytophthora fragariae]KAE9291300.1 hypothetical protein PF001_g19224 [Phytophthora fragariae]
MPFAVRGGGRQVCVFALLPPLSGRGLRYIDCLTEIEEAKASGSTTNTTVAETTCVSGSWVYAENTTFSRCPTRAYEPPIAFAARVVVSRVVGVLCAVAGLLIL